MSRAEARSISLSLSGVNVIVMLDLEQFQLEGIRKEDVSSRVVINGED